MIKAVLCGDPICQSRHRQILQMERGWLHTNRKGSKTAGYPNYCWSVRQCRLSKNCPFCFHWVSTKQQEDGPNVGGCRKKEKSLGLKDKTKKISLGVQGQTYTHKLGACCHEPTGSQELCQRRPLGGGDFNAVGGRVGTLPASGITSSLG